MDIISEIRRRFIVQKQSISFIAREMNLSRPTVRKHIRTIEDPRYQRAIAVAPKLGKYEVQLTTWLESESKLAKHHRRTAQRLFEGLQEQGYQGAYDSVQRFVKHWKRIHQGPKLNDAFVPLLFLPGDACQFDWSEECIELAGVVQKIKVAHFRLANSRQMFVAAYPRETQEMVLDAHNRAFAFFAGVPNRMIYDNLKTVVSALFTGKERRFNRRFLTLANHYLFEPVACTPASGWEKGQVENQVGNIREWLFTPRVRVETFDELNAWLSKRCIELAQRAHPVQTQRSIADCFKEEQALLRPVGTPFDGYVEHLLRVSSTCLVNVDANRYSVPAKAAGQAVSVRVTADQIRIVAQGELIAAHARVYGRNQLVCDPWHYLPILDKKPGALRNGEPFVMWDLPDAIKTVRDHILKQSKGDRLFVEMLMIAGESGIDALTVACELALESGVINAAMVINELRRLISPLPSTVNNQVPDNIQLQHEPLADCNRYNHLLGGHYVH